MSFWPSGTIGKLEEDLSAVRAATLGVPASLHFHQDLDYTCEGERLPAMYDLEVASDCSLNRVYERLLEHNGVHPGDVTLARGEELCRRGENPEVELARTGYTYLPRLIVSKRTEKKAMERQPSDSLLLEGKTILPSIVYLLHCVFFYYCEDIHVISHSVVIPPSLPFSGLLSLFGPKPFFHYNQSCISFCFNLIELADDVNPGVSANFDKADDYRVDWFEKIVREKYLTKKKRATNWWPFI